MRTPRKLLKECKAIVGRTCRLTREIRTRGGNVYPAGSRWEVCSTWRGRFAIHGIDDAGEVELNERDCIARHVRNVAREDFVLEERAAAVAETPPAT